MNKKNVIPLALALTPFVIAGSWVIYMIGTYNNLVGQEEGIKATYNDMQNVHVSIFNQMKSQGLAAEKYGNMVIQALQVGMEGRYGQNGSQAAFQWIQEQNPTIDSKIMDKLQVAIEAGYNKFEAVQRTKIDKLRIYNQNLRTFPSNLAATLMGFPKIDLQKYGATISTAETKKTFESGEMKTIDPFSKE